MADRFADSPDLAAAAAATVSATEPSLAGKVAFVTGAASGLGAALTDALADAGAHIAAADLRADALHARVTRLRERGVRAHGLAFDVGDAAAVRTAIDDCLAHMGSLDILVNNAGTDVTLPIHELSEQDWQRVIGTNLNGPFLLSRAAASHMRSRSDQLGGGGGGDIVNIASTAAKRAWPNASAYHASKWGLLGLSHALHAELRPHGIRVTAVVAGGMRTPFLLDRFPDLDAATLQDPANVARAIVQVLLLPRETVIPELTVLPMQETSWP